MDYNRIQQPKFAGNIYHHGQRELPNTNTNTHSDPYADTNSNSYGHTNSDSATTDTYANCDSDTNSYGDTYANANADSDSYGNTYTDTPATACQRITDDRPYQGSQHTVQFHGTSQPH